jgi:hypothetical protein
MTDSLGFRRKFAVIAPSTNTSVQPEFDAMRPRGVTNHVGRIHIPNDPVHNDDDFNVLIGNIRKETMNAIDDVMTCEPDYLIMGMSSETFWDGLEGSKRLMERVEARAGVAMGSDAAQGTDGDLALSNSNSDCGGQNDFDEGIAREPGGDASAHGRVCAIGPLIPRAVHFILLPHIGDEDQRGQNSILTRACLGQVGVNLSEGRLGLLVKRRALCRCNGKHRNDTVVDDGATTRRISAGKTRDH